MVSCAGGIELQRKGFRCRGKTCSSEVKCPEFAFFSCGSTCALLRGMDPFLTLACCFSVCFEELSDPEQFCAGGNVKWRVPFMFSKENSFFSDFEDKRLFQHQKDVDSLVSQVTSVSQLCSSLSLSDLCFPLSLSDFSHFYLRPIQKNKLILWFGRKMNSNPTGNLSGGSLCSPRNFSLETPFEH